MQKDSETSVIPYTNPQLLLDYWSINTHDRKKRKKDNKTYMYRQYICTLLCYHIGPVYKVSSLDDYSNFFMCCRPATCRYSGFNPSDCMEFTQTYHRIPKQNHHTKSLTARQRGIFLILTDISREDPRVPPVEAISYTFRCVVTLR